MSDSFSRLTFSDSKSGTRKKYGGEENKDKVSLLLVRDTPSCRSFSTVGVRSHGYRNELANSVLNEDDRVLHLLQELLDMQIPGIMVMVLSYGVTSGYTVTTVSLDTLEFGAALLSRQSLPCGNGNAVGREHLSLYEKEPNFWFIKVKMGEIIRRHGDWYDVSNEEIASFQREGYVHLRGVLSEDEMMELEEEFMAFLRREIDVHGRDFCDMSSDYEKPVDSFNIINIMLPSKYNPKLKGSIYERRAASIAKQLLGPDMTFDYDQLLAKPPNKPEAEFKWHQDLAYWPITKDTKTASFWLAIDDARVENGCLQFVPRTHLEQSLRTHGPLHGDRDKSHTLAAALSEGDTPKPMEINRGDVTVHQERLLHGSGGNLSSKSWRRAWVMAFRSRETVEFERKMGFTHSHNDKLEVLNAVGYN